MCSAFDCQCNLVTAAWSVALCRGQNQPTGTGGWHAASNKFRNGCLSFRRRYPVGLVDVAADRLNRPSPAPNPPRSEVQVTDFQAW